jgi:superfamily II DNA or RNA helicase
MKLEESKTKRQEEGGQKWRYNKGRGTYDWCPAMGKTYAALSNCNKMFIQHPNIRIYVVTPSIAIQETVWKPNILKHCFNHKDNFTVLTINYIQENNLRLEGDLIILDEIHEYYSSDRLELVKNFKSKFILGLTGTRKDNKNRYRLMEEIIPVIDIITEKEALDNGWISKFIEFNISTNLTEDERIKYEKTSELIRNLLAKFGRNGLDIANKCLSGGKDEFGNEYTAIQFCTGWALHNGWRNNLNLENETELKIHKMWNPKLIMGYARHLMTAIRDRKNILYNAENKLNKAIEVLKRFDKLKTICFAQSTFFADTLMYKINTEIESNICGVYHSKVKTELLPIGKNGKMIKVGQTRLKRMTLEKFRNNEYRILSTASSLDRGLDINDIRLALICSATQNPTQQKQRGARAKRLELYDKNAIVLIVNLYVKNTQDEKWLRNRQKDTISTVFWVDSVNEITYKPIDTNTLQDF